MGVSGEETPWASLQGTTQSSTRAFLCSLFLSVTLIKTGSSATNEVFDADIVKATSLLGCTLPGNRLADVDVGEDKASMTYKVLEMNRLDGIEINPPETLGAYPLVGDLVWGCIVDKEFLSLMALRFFYEPCGPDILQCLWGTFWLCSRS